MGLAAQAFNHKLLGFFLLMLQLGGPEYHNNIICHARDLFQVCSSVRLPGAVSPQLLHNASLRITLLTVPEVVDAENLVTSSLLFLLDPSSIAKMQS